MYKVCNNIVEFTLDIIGFKDDEFIKCSENGDRDLNINYSIKSLKSDWFNFKQINKQVFTFKELLGLQRTLRLYFSEPMEYRLLSFYNPDINLELYKNYKKSEDKSINRLEISMKFNGAININILDGNIPTQCYISIGINNKDLMELLRYINKTVGRLGKIQDAT